MAGSTTEAQYHSDDGTTYKVRMPTWEFNLNPAGAAATTQATLPRGYLRRKRAVMYDDTRREQQVTVLSAASTLWTDVNGTAIAAPESPDFGTVPGAPNATLQGAIGERRLSRA